MQLSGKVFNFLGDSIPVIDLFAINPLDAADETLLPDGLHPNDDGHVILAQVIAEELLKL